VFEYDYTSSVIKETQLPESFQGAAISERGPLPFLFNAKADRILQRYWIRVVTPKGVEGEYWLEFVPMHQLEAADYQMVQVIIEQKDYLPKAMIVFDKNYSPASPARTTFVFQNRKVNEFRLLPERWRKDFFDVETPQGWQRIVDRIPEPETQPRTPIARQPDGGLAAPQGPRR
jgi:hypothetical protein